MYNEVLTRFQKASPICAECVAAFRISLFQTIPNGRQENFDMSSTCKKMYQLYDEVLHS